MATTRLIASGVSGQPYGSFAGRSAANTNVYQECRKALEARLATATSLSTLTVSWPNRPVTVPGSAIWLRVRPLVWGRAEPMLIGGSTGKGFRRGAFIVDVVGRANTGYGPLNDVADAIRDRFNRVNVSMPSGMHLWCLAPGGPTPETDKGFARVSVRIPFWVSETVPN